MRALFEARFCGAISFLSSLPSSFCLSFSLSFVVVKKAPRPFCFFFLTFSLPLDGTMGVVEKGKAHRRPVQKKKKNQDDSFFGLVFKARLCHHHQQILSFSDCARKSSIATKKTTYSHTRYNSKKNVFRSFLLCWHQSRRQDERPRLFLLEKSLLGASLRGKKIMVGSRCFFLIRKSQAQARERAF